MLGWQIYIFRQPVAGTDDDTRLAAWRAGVGGLDWLEALVKERRALDLGGDGYPKRYGLTAGVLRATLVDGPPPHDGPPVFGDDYTLPGGWIGEVRIDGAVLADCLPEELLIVEAWDQS